MDSFIEASLILDENVSVDVLFNQDSLVFIITNQKNGKESKMNLQLYLRSV